MRRCGDVDDSEASMRSGCQFAECYVDLSTSRTDHDLMVYRTFRTFVDALTGLTSYGESTECITWTGA